MAAREVAGLLVPVIVQGPWDDLTFAPDLESVARRALEDPEAIKRGGRAAGDQRRPKAYATRSRKAVQRRCSKGCWVAGRRRGRSSAQGGQGADAARKLLKGLFGN